MSRSAVPSKRPANDAQEAAWVADEDRFVLQQAKKKAAIRVKGGRAQPIDWLAATLAVIDPDRNPLDDEVETEDLELVEPESVFEGLSDAQLQELEKGVDTYLALEKSRSNQEYWTTMKTICRDRRQQSQSTQPSARGVSSVAGDLDKLLGPKSLEELEKLEKQIKAKLASNEPIDTDYWEHLLRSLLTYKARAKLRRVSQAVVGSRVEGLRKQQAEEAVALKARLDSSLQQRQASGVDGAGQDQAKAISDARHPLDPEPLLRLRPEDKSLDSITEKAFAEKLAHDRQRVLKQGYIPTNHLGGSTSLEPSAKRQRTSQQQQPEQAPSTTLTAFDREVARGLHDNEEIFTAEVPVTTKHLALWSPDHRPRKPRYFARVITGYEWNKYNQTHYDHDNPPPKVVQGYKFNVFYPDLADVTKAPSFRIERVDGRRRGETWAKAGEEDTCVLRFVAGAPYEDVAFRVVDREWDYSAKRERGFRSHFDKGVLQLHFQFKKIYYRK
ncbi:hypothetical protein LTR36_005706 [Oleoguttula mirabilis]|uniref:Splicing factor Cactin n=1 Tax=Oleoguttula mirabilis TaxID=1507867 RepID=A0AAV9JEZ4_9PEZI|nr:hypothetical protein LTR36_005706 [Oleoguttula mirabilis]